MLICTIVALMFAEDDSDHEQSPSVRQTYRTLLELNKLKPLRDLTLLLLTCRLSFAAVDAASQLMLVDAGIPRETLALLGPILLPLNFIATMLVGRWTCGPQALSWWLFGWICRWVLSFSWLGLIYITGHVMQGQQSNVPGWLFGLLLSISALYSGAADVMFSSQMSFFARIADTAVGGTYMTYLNTISNVGGRWPPSFALWTLDWFKNISEIHGFTLQCLICAGVGLIWLFFARPVIRRIQTEPLTSWAVIKTRNFILLDSTAA